MGNFRLDRDSDDERGSSRSFAGGRGRSFGRGGGRGGFGGGRGGFGGGRGRSFGGSRGGFGGRDSRPREMYSGTCDKCGKQCEVPFRPTEGKPLFCSQCFEQQGNASPRSNRSFSNAPSAVASAGVSVEQFNVLSAKVDKILEILESLEVEEDEDEEEEEEEEA
jgi:CxxC-x17-CxxC domain-containing protein